MQNMRIRQTTDEDHKDADFIADTLNEALRVVLISARHHGKRKVHIQDVDSLDPDEKRAMIEELSRPVEWLNNMEEL